MKDTLVKVFLKFRLLANSIADFDGIIKFPPYDRAVHKAVISSKDPIRYAMIALAIDTIKKDRIDGSFAEVGVYKGETSRIIHALDPGRSFYLFDTFEGFPSSDLEVGSDSRFQDTSVEIVKDVIGDMNNIILRKGYFPETAKGLEDETFSFVMLDLDLYKPTLAGLEFFYPRVRTGGYIFAHDYNSPESNHAVSRAVDEFLKDKPEKAIGVPDKWGSVMFRKVGEI